MFTVNAKNRYGRFRLNVLLIAILVSLGTVGNSGASSHESSGDLVLVAGATGKTGRFVVEELLANGFRVRAFVRDTDKAREILHDDIEFAKGDVKNRESIDAALGGVASMIIAIGSTRGDPDNSPEHVDYGGVKNLIEGAADAGVDQFVLVSSGGVTHEEHVLNEMFDNILVWKFKGEEAVRNSGVDYTIVRPGGLVNKPGGQTQVVFQQGDNVEGIIPRADVAQVCVQALMFPEARNRTLEIIGGTKPLPQDWQSSFAALQSDE